MSFDIMQPGNLRLRFALPDAVRVLQKGDTRVGYRHPTYLMRLSCLSSLQLHHHHRLMQLT